MIENEAQEERAITTEQFIERQQIGMFAAQWPENPLMSDASPTMSHWRCRFNKPDGRRMATYFSMGAALTGPPKAEDVLDCLANDAAGIENTRSFEEWCGEYGFDTDSRKAYNAYHVARMEKDRLRTFLGLDAYDTLLWHTQRR